MTYPVAAPLSATSAYASVPGNQFAWSANPNVPASTVFSRYVYRESNGVEIGGTAIGDLNGDGYSDYLMTFEGHAEVCYSRGIVGFDCYVMEDDTPAGYTQPVPPPRGSYPPAVTVINPTIAPDPTTGLFSVYSVLSVGHANDHNIPEIIYRRSDGNGATPGNVYSVCTIHDGMRSCQNWTGPRMRGAFNETMSYGQQGPNQSITFSTINWPIAGTLAGDYTGHGRTEILFYCNSSDTTVCPEGFGWQLYTPNVNAQVDRLTQVVNGIGNTTKIDYQPMGVPPAVGTAPIYVQQPTDGTTVVYPLHTIADGGRMLVSALHVDRGDGNFLTSTYQYEGLATDVTGRGEQGFERVTITNPEGTVHSTQYAQGFPYTGMELSHKLTSSTGCALEQTANTLATLNSSTQGAAVYPYVKTAAQMVHVDLNCASLLPLTTNTVNSIDNYGDITSSLSSTLDQVSGNQYTTTTNNTPLVLLNPYVIGPSIYTSVTKTAPNQKSITRTKQFDYYGQAQASVCTRPTISGIPGLLQDEISECYPGTGVSAQLSVQTNYFRDTYGNVAQTQQNWQGPVISGSTISQAAQSRNTFTQYEPGIGRFLITSINAIGQSEQHGYDDGTGAKNKLTDINQLVTTWTNDGFGRVLTENRPDGTTTKFFRKQCTNGCPSPAYNTGDLSPIPSVVTIQEHVLTNSPSTMIAVPELDYVDAAGHYLRKQSYGFDGTEIDTDDAYDQYGRPAVTFQPTFAGNAPLMAQSSLYDELSRVTQVSQYDDGGNLTNTVTTYNGLSTTVTNPLQYTRTSINDALGQLVQTIDAAGTPTYFTRDAFGSLLQTQDVKNNVVTITYDNLGRKTSLQDPDLGFITYSIDPLGREYQQVNPNERAAQATTTTSLIATTFVYDMLDRMTQRMEPALGSSPGLTSVWVYDNLPSPTASPTPPSCAVPAPAVSIPSSAPSCAATASCGKLVEAYTQISAGKDYDRVQTYDSIGRSSATSISAYQGSYTGGTCYDKYNRTSSIIDQWVPLTGSPLVKTFAQYYNGFGYLAQVARVTGSGSNTVAQVLWQSNVQDAEDRVLQAALGNGLNVKRDYYPYSERLQDTYLNNQASNTALLQEGYQYDVLGNVATRTEYWNANASQTGFSETFTYDNMNRLFTSQVNTNGKASLQQFTYDAIGNITNKSGVGNYSYLGNNVTQPHAVSAVGSMPGSFSYDVNGNMTGDPYGRNTSWNSFDMPVQITMGGNSSYFTYGAEHQRTRQSRGDKSIIAYAGTMEIVFSSNNTSTVKTYWPNGLGVEIDANGAPTTLNWTHTDNLGSVVAVTGGNGTLEESMAYDPWGARLDLIGDAQQQTNYHEVVDNKGFTDQEMLDQLNLVHLNGRVYDPLVGRFISADPEIQDPTHSQSYNRYAYVWNNPTNMTDPTGFWGVDGGSSDEVAPTKLPPVQVTPTGMLGISAAAFAGANPELLAHNGMFSLVRTGSVLRAAWTAVSPFQKIVISAEVGWAIGTYAYNNGLGDGPLKFQPDGINANALSSGSFAAAEQKKEEEEKKADGDALDGQKDETKSPPVPEAEGGERHGKGPRIWNKPPSSDPVEEANKDFDNMGIDPSKVGDKGNGVRVGVKDDGKRVIVRPGSSEGSGNVPTIEIQNPNGKPLDKIRYPMGF